MPLRPVRFVLARTSAPATRRPTPRIAFAPAPRTVMVTDDVRPWRSSPALESTNERGSVKTPVAAAPAALRASSARIRQYRRPPVT